MSETMLLNLLGLLGFALFIFGIWLLRKGRGIEQKARHEYGTKNAVIFGNHFPQRFLELWDPHSLKPLAYFSVAAGLVLLLIFIFSLF